MFRSFKSSGFRIEDTHLIHIEIISSRLSIVAISFSFSCLVGTVKSKIEKIETESHGRKAKSLFRVGLDETGQINPWLPKNDKKYMRIITVRDKEKFAIGSSDQFDTINIYFKSIHCLKVETARPVTLGCRTEKIKTIKINKLT